MRNHLVRFLALGILFTAACSKRATGSENGQCYANRTCNEGLTCLSDTCVNPGGDAGPSTDGAASMDMVAASNDAAVFNDMGMPCPGASIFHPGTEPRNVGSSVPFSGRGRDPTCAPITGSALVWTDSLEGQIGTGEMFNHTFTMTGSHTVTLAAKDSAQNVYTAMVTFSIM